MPPLYLSTPHDPTLRDATESPPSRHWASAPLGSGTPAFFAPAYPSYAEARMPDERTLRERTRPQHTTLFSVMGAEPPKNTTKVSTQDTTQGIPGKPSLLPRAPECRSWRANLSGTRLILARPRANVAPVSARKQPCPTSASYH